MTVNDCWETAKRVWPELTDDMPAHKKATYTGKVAEVAWGVDSRLHPLEAKKIRKFVKEWEGGR